MLPMKFRSLCMVAACMAISAIALGQTSSETKPEKIQASGCVQAGVEGGCTVLKDAKSDKLYNLFFASDKKPAPDTAISFAGTAHNGMTTCMQGTAVDVKKWKLKTKCEKAAPEK